MAFTNVTGVNYSNIATYCKILEFSSLIPKLKLMQIKNNNTYLKKCGLNNNANQ